jgi:hypothetical protein
LGFVLSLGLSMGIMIMLTKNIYCSPRHVEGNSHQSTRHNARFMNDCSTTAYLSILGGMIFGLGGVLFFR